MTNAVAELTMPLPTRRPKHAATLLCKSDHFIFQLFLDNCQKYISYHFVGDPDGNEKHDLVKADFNQQQVDADAALKLFRSLFCRRPVFAGPDRGQDFLASRKSDVDGLAHEMREWALNLLEERINMMYMDGRYWERVESKSATSLNNKITDVAGSPPSGTPALWPLVDKVINTSAGSRILQYVILADLPGLFDDDPIRVAACKDYLRICQFIDLVAERGRASDCSVVTQFLQQYGEEFRDRILVAITRADISKASEIASNLKQKGQSCGNYERLSKEEHSKVTKTCKAAEGAEKERLKKVADGLVHRMEEEARIARNKYVTNVFLQKKEDFIPKGTTLPVFLIANGAYLDIKEAPKGSLEAAKATGVGALRDHILRMVAQSHFTEFYRWTKHAVKTAFAALEPFANESRLLEHDGTLSIVNRPHAQIQISLAAYPERARRLADDSMKPTEACGSLH